MHKHMEGRIPQIVGIAGGSCAGKSWLAERIIESLGQRAVRVSLDNFYLDRSSLSAGRRARLNFDHPRAIDWPRFEETLCRCASHRSFSVPCYDFSTHARQAGESVFAPVPVVIAEGLWLFRRASIRRLLTLKIFIRSTEEICVSRRLQRDTRERGRNLEQVRAQLGRYTLPMSRRYVAPQEKWADLILEAPIRAEDVSLVLKRIAENLCAVGI
jgi:uridine kinase